MQPASRRASSGSHEGVFSAAAPFEVGSKHLSWFNAKMTGEYQHPGNRPEAAHV